MVQYLLSAGGKRRGERRKIMRSLKMAGRIGAVLAAVLLFAAAAGCGKADNGSKPQENTSQDVSAQEEQKAADSGMLTGLHHVEITVKDYGVIKLELDADTAPITVSNFCFLANKGFYDGLTFHRIMDGFMIQGGDPEGNGSGGSGFNITGEFASNGVENNISHVKGVISMARAKNPDSASSQFFIMVGDGTYLDGDYAAFGHVTEGQEVADKIAADARPVDNNGTIRSGEQPVIESIKVID